MRSTLKVWIGLIVLFVLAPAAMAQSAADAAREKWQRVPDILAAMGVSEGSAVADVGAGGGFMTVRLATAVGSTGKVYAVDIVPAVVTRLRDQLVKSTITNVDVIEGAVDDPRLPLGALDAIVVINAYHEFTQHATMLDRFRDALKPGGRLVLCEPVPLSGTGPSRAEQVKLHQLSPDLIVEELKAAGFDITRREDAFAANPARGLYTLSLVVASKPAPPPLALQP